MTKAKVIAIDSEKRRARIRFAVVFGFTLIVMMTVMALQCVAQDFQSLSIDAAFTGADATDKIKAADRVVKDAAATGSFGAEGDLYMLGYWIPRMTQTDTKTLSSLGKYRVAFLKKFLDKKMSPTGRRSVIGKLLPELRKIAGNDKFHPAVRVNAVTIMGMLYDSQQEKWPSPSPAAYAALKEILNSASAKDYLKVAALSGIANFAEVSRGGNRNSIPGQDLKSQLAAIINGKSAGQDKWSDDLNYWMKRRATQVFGQIGTADTIDISSAVMKGKNLNVDRDDFWLRYDGLNALRNLRFKSDASIASKAPQMIDDVLEFAAFAMDRESKWINAKVEDLVYTNILWNDLDLNTSKRRRMNRNNRGGSRGPGGREGGGGGLGDGDITGSGGGGGPKGGGRGGGSGFDGGPRNPEPSMDSEHVELPIFMLNDSRARAKSVLLSARDFLKVKEGGLIAIVDDETKTRIEDEILPVLEEWLSETELGVIDYRKLKGEEPDTKDVTFRLEKIYANAAEGIRAVMSNQGGNVDAADGDIFSN